jgi:hypothetical protein
VGLDKRRSLQKKSGYTRRIAPWSLDSAGRIKKVKTSSDKKQEIFAHESHSAFRLTVGFSKIYFEIHKIFRSSVINLSFKCQIKIKTKLKTCNFLLLSFTMLLCS